MLSGVGSLFGSLLTKDLLRTNWSVKYIYFFTVMYSWKSINPASVPSLLRVELHRRCLVIVLQKKMFDYPVMKRSEADGPFIHGKSELRQ